MKIHDAAANIALTALAITRVMLSSSFAAMDAVAQQEDPNKGGGLLVGRRNRLGSSNSYWNSFNVRSDNQVSQTLDVTNPPTTAAPSLPAEPTVSASPSASLQPSTSPTASVAPTTSAEPTMTPVPTAAKDPTTRPTARPTVPITLEPTEEALQLNDTICVEGYIMDWYCIERGTLLDNSRIRTLEGPDQHSVHCLVDVGICYNSWYEVLVEPLIFNEERATMEYQRGWRIYETNSYQTGKQAVIDLGRRTGDDCSTCTGHGSLTKGFRAAIRGRLVDFASRDDGGNIVPPLIDVIDVKASHDTVDPCGTFFGMAQQDVLN